MFTRWQALQLLPQTSTSKHTEEDDGQALSWAKSYSLSSPMALCSYRLDCDPLLVEARGLLVGRGESHEERSQTHSLLYLASYSHNPNQQKPPSSWVSTHPFAPCCSVLRLRFRRLPC